MYVPFHGVVVSDDDLRLRVDRHFHWPMIVLALAVLPLLAIELFVQPARGSAQWWFSAIGMTVIWLAFVIEFVVKIAIAESRLEYVRRNWLDLIIIVVPVLRPMRATAVVRTSRMLKVRGVGMKLVRLVITFLIGLEATDRLRRRLGIAAVADKKDPARMTRHQLMDEVRRLRHLSDSWEAWYEAHRAYLDEHGHVPGEASIDETVPEAPRLEPAPDAAGEIEIRPTGFDETTPSMEPPKDVRRHLANRD